MNGRGRIAWNLRRLRTLRGTTQEALAVDAHLDRTSVSGIENEAFSASIDVLDRLAASLEVDVVELLLEPTSDAIAPLNLPRGRKAK